MNINSSGIKLITDFEGCKLNAYKDIVGVLTIGYGHTGPEVHEGLVISMDDAIQTLKTDMAKFEDIVNSLVTVQINENQFSALIAFTYNLGKGPLQKSTLLKLLNDGNISDAGKQILLFTKAGGKVISGLIRRRRAEYNLFNTPV
jgi:lysozyme